LKALGSLADIMNAIPIPAQFRSDSLTDALDLAQPTVSILIPVYNVEEYLNDCVQSILSQARDCNIEILLLDDCSTDTSREICLELCVLYPDRIRLLSHDQNSGLSAARNSLLEASRGEYLWFIDSDDYLLPGTLQKLMTIIASQSPDLILCDYEKRRFLKKKTFPGSGRKLQDDKVQLISGVFQHRKMYAWSRISRRSLWGSDLRFPPGRTFEDIATTPWLLLRAKTFYYVPESWVFYRRRAGSIMTSVTRTRGVFDTHKNDDMATAMIGFKPLLRDSLAGEAHQPAFYASQFVAKEFVKLADRFNTAQNSPLSLCGTKPATLRPYFEKMQEASPIDFATLSRLYLKTFRIYDFFALRRALRLVNAAVTDDR
jgi:glycosyltransferase involved in cell wall biosynthesis